MPGFNNPGCDYGRDDTNSLRRIAEALERIADNMEKENENSMEEENENS